MWCYVARLQAAPPRRARAGAAQQRPRSHHAVIRACRGPSGVRGYSEGYSEPRVKNRRAEHRGGGPGSRPRLAHGGGPARLRLAHARWPRARGMIDEKIARGHSRGARSVVTALAQPTGSSGRNSLRWDHARHNYARGLQGVVDKQVFDRPSRVCAQISHRAIQSRSTGGSGPA
jgi:hypothetical protein